MLTTNSGSFGFSFSINHSSGVAPLAVFFDTIGTTSALTSSPFTDIEYVWDFGDVGSGNWGSKSTGAAGSGAYPSRNAFRGPVACHVYETAGNYTATLTATYGGATITTKTFPITVTDPNTVFATTDTIAVNVNGDADFSAAPAGATTYNTPLGDLLKDALLQIAGTKKRILFKRGSTWNAAPGTTQPKIQVTGPGVLGAYGAGAAPIFLQSDNSSNGIVELTNGASDWRIQDIKVDGGSQTLSVAFQPYAALSQITFINITVANTQWGWNMNLTNITDVQQIAVHDCSLDTASPGIAGQGYCFFGGQRYVSVQGNSFNSADRNHNIRSSPQKGVFANNKLYATTKTNANVVNDIKIYGRTATAETSEYFIVSGNKFEENTIGIVPQDFTQTEVVRNWIVERNWCVQASTISSALLMCEMGFGNGTFRNNLYNATYALTVGRVMGEISYRSTAGNTAPPANVTVYNNSMYTGDSVASGAFTAFSIGRTGKPTLGSGIVLRNNAAYAPSATLPLMIVDFTSGNYTASNNMSDAQVLSSQPFITIPPATAAGFAANGAVVVGQGIVVPVWADFILAVEPTPRDIGGYNH